MTRRNEELAKRMWMRGCPATSIIKICGFRDKWGEWSLTQFSTWRARRGLPARKRKTISLAEYLNAHPKGSGERKRIADLLGFSPSIVSEWLRRKELLTKRSADQVHSATDGVVHSPYRLIGGYRRWTPKEDRTIKKHYFMYGNARHIRRAPGRPLAQRTVAACEQRMRTLYGPVVTKKKNRAFGPRKLTNPLRHDILDIMEILSYGATLDDICEMYGVSERYVKEEIRKAPKGRELLRRLDI